jgi:mannose-6-phosphate isomerase-like protein (cupin superfamily)
MPPDDDAKESEMSPRCTLAFGAVAVATGWATAGLAPPKSHVLGAAAPAAQGSTAAQGADSRESGRGRKPFHVNVFQAARDNDAYRRVLFTGDRTQLALMTIPVGGDIGFETHPHVEQLVFIASGEGEAALGGDVSKVGPGDVVVVTPGTRHDVVNTGHDPLRIYTVYAPPNHIDGRVHETKADAEADRADEEFGREVR